MGVATHLGIDLAEYDRRIRTFIPDYDEMLSVAVSAVPPSARTVVDLGTGTGALAAGVAARARGARIVAIDADPEILAVAARRLGRRASTITGSFLQAPIPRCDAVVTSFALHHVRTRPPKARLYRRLHRALRPGGCLVIVDCQPASNPTLARAQREVWRTHLRRAHTPRESARLLEVWAREDVYVPLDAETALLADAGFAVDVLWRKGPFAVIVGT